jgi:hypothetical protein
VPAPTSGGVHRANCRGCSCLAPDTPPSQVRRWPEEEAAFDARRLPLTVSTPHLGHSRGSVELPAWFYRSEFTRESVLRPGRRGGSSEVAP